MSAPLQLTFPALARVRTLTAWTELPYVLPELDVEQAVAGLHAWANLDEDFGDPAGAAAHRRLAATLDAAHRRGVPEAFLVNAQAMRAKAPADVAPKLEIVDRAIAELLHGDDNGAARAEAAWIELANSDALQGLPDPLRVSLLCDGIALHELAFAVTGNPTGVTHRAGLLEHTLLAFRSLDGAADSCRVHLDPRLSRISGALGVSLVGSDPDGASDLLQRTVAIIHPRAPDSAVWFFEEIVAAETPTEGARQQVGALLAGEPAGSRLADRARQWLEHQYPDPGDANNLAGQYLLRFDERGDLDDLHRAVDLLTGIDVDGLPVAQAAGTLGNLTTALRTRARMTGRAEDLTAAQDAADRAVLLTGTAPGELSAAALAVRASVAFDLFERHAEPAQLDSAIADWRVALTVGPAEHRALVAYNLGNALLRRDEVAAGELTEAVNLLATAVRRLHRPSPDAALAGNRLAEAVHRRARRSARPSDDTVDVNRAVRWSARAMDWAARTSSETLLRVAWDAGMRAENDHDWARAATAYARVVDAVHGLVISNRSTRGRDTWLGEGFGAPTRAAASWARAGHPDQAILVLERGRGLLLRDAFGQQPMSEADGFMADALPTPIEPLVYLVPARDSGLALILNPASPGSAQVVELPGLTESALGEVVRRFHTAAGKAGADVRGWRLTLDRTLNWLDRTLEPVAAALPAGPVSVIPTGALSFLPVHTAFPGRVVSTTPTAAALAALHARAGPGNDRRSLVVADPSGTTLKPLRFAAAEATVAAAYAEQALVLLGPDATVEKVVEAMSRCTVLHLACHASADVRDPRTSHLVLADDRHLDVATMVDLDLNSVGLVVLSACETGVPGAGAPDENLSLATSLVVAGAEGVVSSLWQVPDLPTLVLVTCLYGFLADGLRPAAALHRAQTVLRDHTRTELEGHLTALHDSGRLPRATLQLIVEELSGRGGPASTPLSTADYWAAFVFTGC